VWLSANRCVVNFVRGGTKSETKKNKQRRGIGQRNCIAAPDGEGWLQFSS
jgi:hypothetical protein